MMPKMALGKLAIVLILLCPALFLVGRLFLNLYASVPSGETVLEDIVKRPAVSVSMLLGMVSGIAAFIVGAVSIFKLEERSFLVYLATAAGGLVLLFVAAEIVFPH